MIVSTVEQQSVEVGLLSPRRYLPFLGTIFLFVAVSSVLTIVPGYVAPTGSLSTTAALALSVFVAVPVFGIAARGPAAYLSSYLEPTALMLPFNIISELSRTLALAIRLFGNVMSDTMIVGMFAHHHSVFLSGDHDALRSADGNGAGLHLCRPRCGIRSGGDAADVSGEGAKRTGGRWNAAGVPVIYASRTRALACLETMVHLTSAMSLPMNRYLVELTLPDAAWNARVQFAAPFAAVGWDAEPPGRTSMQWGTEWLTRAESLLAEVPSIVVPEETNILINPAHPDIAVVAARTVRKWSHDRRFRAVE